MESNHYDASNEIKEIKVCKKKTLVRNEPNIGRELIQKKMLKWV